VKKFDSEENSGLFRGSEPLGGVSHRSASGKDRDATDKKMGDSGDDDSSDSDKGDSDKTDSDTTDKKGDAGDSRDADGRD
jgi:hypothetical protein